MVQESGCEDKVNKLDSHHNVTEDLALLVTLTSFEPKFITVSRQIFLNAMFGTPVRVCTKDVGLMAVVPYENMSRKQACKTANVSWMFNPASRFTLLLQILVQLTSTKLSTEKLVMS